MEMIQPVQAYCLSVETTLRPQPAPPPGEGWQQDDGGYWWRPRPMAVRTVDLAELRRQRKELGITTPHPLDVKARAESP